MAKVKITGHASGSGVLTITAPNTSTDRTITLPDATGTLLNSNGSAASLTAIPAAQITGTLPAINGASLTGVTGRKNMITNGGFDVWQRGTSLAGASKFLADRWFNTTSETQSRQTFTVGQTDVPHNPVYYHRGTGGSTEWYERRQTIENVAITAGREVTLSYWMKGSSAFTNAPYSDQDFGSSGSSNVAVALSTASITTSWARYTHTFTPAAINGKTVGASNYLKLSVLRANLNNITVEMANVQFEFGSVATDFEQRSYGEELALCQRYYQRIGDVSRTSYGTLTAHTGTGGYCPCRFMTTMRASPSQTHSATNLFYITGDGQNQALSSGQTFGSEGMNPNGVTIGVTGSSLTGGKSYWFNTTATEGWIAWEAEI